MAIYFKSVDGGKTWELIETGLPFKDNSEYTNGVFSLTLESSNPDILYLGTNYQGVFKSMNGGQLWIRIHDSIPISPSATRFYKLHNYQSKFGKY